MKAGVRCCRLLPGTYCNRSLCAFPFWINCRPYTVCNLLQIYSRNWFRCLDLLDLSTDHLFVCAQRLKSVKAHSEQHLIPYLLKPQAHTASSKKSPSKSLAVPFHRAAGFEASGVLPKAPGGARSAAGYSGHQVHAQSRFKSPD